MQGLPIELAQAINDSKPTLVEFFTPGCARCHSVAATVDELKEDLGDRVNIVKIDTTAYPELVKKYDVRACPSWIIFKDGTVAWHDGGVKLLSELKDMVRRFI